MNEVKRIEDFESGKFNCIKCNKEMTFWFNGGELDENECCGLTYSTEVTSIDLVVRNA